MGKFVLYRAITVVCDIQCSIIDMSICCRSLVSSAENSAARTPFTDAIIESPSAHVLCGAGWEVNGVTLHKQLRAEPTIRWFDDILRGFTQLLPLNLAVLAGPAGMAPPKNLL